MSKDTSLLGCVRDQDTDAGDISSFDKVCESADVRCEFGLRNNLSYMRTFRDISIASPVYVVDNYR